MKSLIREGKVDNVAAEAERMKLDILGVSDVRRLGIIKMNVGSYEFIYSRGEKHTEVGVMMKKGIAKYLGSYWSV